MRRYTSITTLLILTVVLAPSWAERNSAPLGNYQATTGDTVRKVGRGGKQAASRRTDTRATAGSTFTISLLSFTSPSELDDLKGLTGTDLFKAINSHNHGTVEIAGKSYPINLASSHSTASGGRRVHLLSTKGFGSEGQTNGLSMGYITFVVDGTGKLYTSAQVRVRDGGELVGVAARTSTTPLTSVTRN